MALLGRADLDNADDLKHEDVPVPEWGGMVRVREMTGSERSQFEATLIAVKGESVEFRQSALKTLREQTLVKCLIDEQGNRLYGDSEAAKLGGKSGQILDRLFQVAQRLSGLDRQARSVAEGNSEAAQRGSSDSV